MCLICNTLLFGFSFTDLFLHQQKPQLFSLCSLLSAALVLEMTLEEDLTIEVCPENAYISGHTICLAISLPRLLLYYT